MQHDRRTKQCFRHYETATVRKARVTEQGFEFPAKKREWIEGLTADKVLEEIDRLRAANPDRGLFEICRMLGVCPTGLLDPEDWQEVEVEAACREYGASYLAAHGFDPAPASLLESMAVIRETRNTIQARKWAEMERDSKRRGGSRV
jgi:hypothetical protein